VRIETLFFGLLHNALTVAVSPPFPVDLAQRALFRSPLALVGLRRRFSQLLKIAGQALPCPVTAAHDT
jgi:hypothetical protein